MIDDLIVAAAASLFGAWFILILTKRLDNVDVHTVGEKFLYFIAAGWLVLFSVFLLCVLSSLLEALP
jgi:hypothetical protein